MPNKPLSEQKRAEVVRLLRAHTPSEEVARIAGVAMGTVANVKRDERQKAGVMAPLADRLRQALKHGPRTQAELADALDCSPKRVREAVAALRAQGTILLETDDGFGLGSAEFLEKRTVPIAATKETWNHRFGLVGDNHLCNKHSRLDVLRAAYDTFERERITTVFNTGNWIDGEHKFTRPESIVRPGMDAQIEYLLENYPQRQNMVTHYIAGDDHEGWYQQRECIEIGKYLQLKAEAAGREDLKYLGYAEADVQLTAPGGTICMRVVHPGGGSAYAISYTDQKRVESYQGGEKPQIEVVGHYHKYNVGYPREVYTVQTGCTCDQTLFMRKKRLQAMVGFLILEIQQDPGDGHLIRARHEWFPFFDRGYYERRF